MRQPFGRHFYVVGNEEARIGRFDQIGLGLVDDEIGVGGVVVLRRKKRSHRFALAVGQPVAPPVLGGGGKIRIGEILPVRQFMP